MTRWEGLRDRFAPWRERLTQTRRVSALERFGERITALSPSDRVIFYILSFLVCTVSIISLYAVEQSFLVVQPAYGGSLVEGIVGSPRFANPLLAMSSADHDLTALTYAGLMGLSGSGELVPVLAESYEISEDGKTYTFILRPGVKFSDGTPITASDVVFTVKKAQSTVLKSPQYANWSGVIAEDIDDQTVRFTLSKSYAPFLGITVLGILPARLWQTISDEEFYSSNLQTYPMGAGPFKIKKVSRDASGLIRSVSLVQNEHYALGRPYLDSIRLEFYSRAEDMADALVSGVIESAHDLPDGGLTSRPLTAPYARVYGVFWNQNENQAYTRIEVRKALSLAIDRTGIVTKVLNGFATPIMGPVPPNRLTTQVPVPQFDNPTAAAAQILKDAGWVYDSSVRVWKNASLKQTLSAITIRTSNVPELKNVASAVKADWERLGIPVNVELYEPGDLSQNIIRPRKYEALLYGMVIGRDQDLYAFWDSQERTDPGLNIALYANKTVDALLEDARSNTNAITRRNDLQKIEDTVAADYPAAFIYAPDFSYSLPKNLQGVSLPQIIIASDRFATVKEWYRETDAVWPIFTSKN